MVLCLGEPSRSFLFCCLSLFVDVFHSVVVLPIAIRHHPSPFRWLSPSFYTHFVLLAQSIAEWFATLSFLTIPLSSYRERYGFEWAFFTLSSFPTFLAQPAFIKASLGAGSYSLKFTGLHTNPQNTDPAHLILWFTVIYNLLYILNLYLYISILQKFLLVVKTLIENIDQQPHYSAAMEI